MPTRLIEIGIPTEKLSIVKPLFELCLKNTGDLLIGMHSYEDHTLIVVQLINDTLQTHLQTLYQAFQQDMVSSFQIISCSLLRLRIQSDNIVGLMRSFPLDEGESWFLASDDAQSAYLCLRHAWVNQDQWTWFNTHITCVQRSGGILLEQERRPLVEYR